MDRKVHYKLVEAVRDLGQRLEKVASLLQEIKETKDPKIEKVRGRLEADLTNAQDSLGYAFWNACSIRDYMDTNEVNDYLDGPHDDDE